MAIPKICGIETEYGISVRDRVDFNPILTSSLLINAYAKPAFKRVKWDYEEENPLRDARGFERAPAEGAAVEDDSGLVNVILPNGSRYYVDHAHPEYSSPECSNARDGVIWDKAGERILEDSIQAAGADRARTGENVFIYKNNSDGKGNSYGCHENYLVDRKTPFPSLVKHLIPFFVTRQVFTGCGEGGGRERLATTSTTRSRSAPTSSRSRSGSRPLSSGPIINTRDEPHADPEKYRRLHVIVGDANMAEISTYLEGRAPTALVLEDDRGRVHHRGLRPGRARACDAHGRRHDPSCRATIELADGRRLTRGRAAVGVPAARQEVRPGQRDGPAARPTCSSAGSGCSKVSRGIRCRSPTRLDWVAKLSLLEAYRDRDGLEWDHPKLRLIDLQYHDVRARNGSVLQARRRRQDRPVGDGRRDRVRDRPSARGHQGLLPGRVPAPLQPTRSWPPPGTR